MRRFVIFITLLFALFTFINAYTSERMPDAKNSSAAMEKTLRQ